MRRTRQSSAGLLEDRLRELRPRAVAVGGDVPDAEGEVERRLASPRPGARRTSGEPRWSSTTATSSRSAPSLSIVRTKFEPRRPEEPRAAHDPRLLARGGLAVKLRAAVRGGGVRAVGLDVRLPLAPVEDVVARVRRRAAPRAPRRGSCRRRSPRPRPADRPRRRRRPSRRPCAARGRARAPPAPARRRPSRRASSATISSAANSSASAWPSWPPAPVIRTGRARRGSGSRCSTGA